MSGERKIMCGMGVTPHQLPNCQGFVLHLDNKGSTDLRLDIDFQGSENLKLLDQDPPNDNIIMRANIAQVHIRPEEEHQIALSCVQQNQGIGLKYLVSPSATTTTHKLEGCDVFLHIRSLASCKGYHLDLDNPNDKGWELEFDFGNSENLTLTGGSADREKSTAKVKIPAKEKRDSFANMTTTDVSKPTNLAYSCKARPMVN